MSNGQKILVVDDDPDMIEQVSLVLAGDGYEMITAGGQHEAEECLMTHRPDLAIVDLMMEEQDSGFILCHEIKRLYPGTPVILLTSVKAATGISFATTNAEQQSWVQADRLLDKPARPEQLKNEVRRLLAARSVAEPA
jgi:CheY-like chemotaxis protein